MIFSVETMATSTTNSTRRPFNGVKLMEIVLGIILLAIITLLLLGFYPISNPRLTQKVVEMARQRGLDSCAVGKVTVAVWKGVSFHDVSLAGTTPSGDRYAVKVPVIVLRCNLFMLAIKYGKIKKLVFEEFKDFKKIDPRDPARALEPVLRVVGASKYFKGAAVFRADVIMEKKKSFSIQGSGITMNVIFPEGDVNRFKGSFSAAVLAWSNVEVACQMSGDFSYDDGTVAFARCKAKAFDGRMKLDTRINLEKHTLGMAAFSVVDLNIGDWSRFSDTSDGRLSGKADIRFTLDSSRLLVDSLHGKGTMMVSHFEIVRFPFQQSLVTMLMYPGLAHLNFRKFRANLNLKPGNLFETDATGEGDTLSVKFDGWIRTDGLLNEKLECRLTKAGVATLPDFAQKTLEEAPGGGRVLKCRLYGMIQNPKVSVESKVILQKAVQNMFEEVKNNLQLWMR